MIFQSTLPARGATFGDALFELPQVHFNPRSPHGERQEFLDETYDYKPVNFNPRSPHGERPLLLIVGMRHENFNPRSPHGERLLADQVVTRTKVAFQSTLPARGATLEKFAPGFVFHFNPRSPHGERRAPYITNGRAFTISIHAPRTGSDVRRNPQKLARLISIHAPRTGSDCDNGECPGSGRYFNPRSPHGERH